MAPSPFGAQLLTLPQIFEQHLFTIPDYQRGYAWDERQVDELLKDLDHLILGEVTHRHYTGTLVLTKSGARDPIEFDVVDGQQRLTTLVIMLRVVADVLPAEDRTLFTKLYLRRGNAGAGRSVLRLNADTRQFFERVVLGDGRKHAETATLEAHERLLRARQRIQAWVSYHINQRGTTPEQLRAALEQNLGFLVYAPEEDAETGIMFEVINNRGKPLSELEKVKNYLIYACVKLDASTLRDEIDADWSHLLRNLNAARKTSPADEGAFLRYSMAVHFKLNKTDSQQGYEQLKRLLALDAALLDLAQHEQVIQEISDFANFLKAASLWYARLYGQDHKGLPDGMGAVMDRIRAQDRHASIMPLFLAIVIKPNGSTSAAVRLLNVLERVNFRVYMCRGITQRNDSGQGPLYQFAADYFHGNLHQRLLDEDDCVLDAANEDQALEYRLVEFCLKFSPDARFLESLVLAKGSPDDFYKWPGLRYFLMSYEQDLQPNKTIRIDKITMDRSAGKSADYLSIEHRWAVGYRDVKGENNRPVDRFEKRRLGNFVLLELRLNIQGSNGNLEDKLSRYIEGEGVEAPSDLQQVREVARDARQVLKDIDGTPRTKNYYLKLNQQINDKAETRLCKFAEGRWSLKDFFAYRLLKKRAESVLVESEE